LWYHYATKYSIFSFYWIIAFYRLYQSFSDYDYLNNYEQLRIEVTKAFLVARSRKLVGSSLYSIETLKPSNACFNLKSNLQLLLNYLGCKSVTVFSNIKIHNQNLIPSYSQPKFDTIIFTIKIHNLRIVQTTWKISHHV